MNNYTFVSSQSYNVHLFGNKPYARVMTVYNLYTLTKKYFLQNNKSRNNIILSNSNVSYFDGLEHFLDLMRKRQVPFNVQCW